jgi:hypothetical protein
LGIMILLLVLFVDDEGYPGRDKHRARQISPRQAPGNPHRDDFFQRNSRRTLWMQKMLNAKEHCGYGDKKSSEG